MKNICTLICLALLAAPVLATEAPINVELPPESTVEKADDAVTDPVQTCDESADLDFPLEAPLNVDISPAAGGCYSCCSACDDVTSRIPCNDWCGCSCEDAHIP